MIFKKKKENELEQIERLLISKYNKINKYPPMKRVNSFVLWAKFLESWRDTFLEETKK